MTSTLAIYLGTTEALSGQPDMLTANERLRMRGMSSERRRRQFRAGRSLVRLALSHHTSSAAAAWRFTLHDGRPMVDGDDSPHFSLSHSGTHVGCVINRSSRCGFDLQLHRAGTRGIAAEYFAPLDNAWLACQSDFDRAFHQLWVLKEAWAKATGTPLLSALTQVCWAKRDAAAHRDVSWDAGTAALSDALTVGWAVACASVSPEVHVWHGSDFAPVELFWTRWDLIAQASRIQCAI